MTTTDIPENSDHVEVTFPSTLFPGPPTIGLRIPPSWIALSPRNYVQPARKVDMAVCGPRPIDGVTPSIVVTVLRTLPLRSPQTFLTELFDQESTEYDEVIEKQYLSLPRPTIAAVTRSQFPNKRMEHLQVLSYVHDNHLAHIINTTGVYAAGSQDGKQVVFNIIEPKQPQP